MNPYTLAELKDTIVPRAQMKAEAEESPLACALLVARTIENVISRASVVTEIATTYDDAGQLDRVLQILKTTRDKQSRNRVLSEMISKHLHPDLYDQAVRIANSVEDNSEAGRDAAWARASALSQVADEYLEDEQYDQALMIAETMKDDTPKADVLARIASKYAEAGAQEKAAELLSQALQIAKTRQGAEAKAQALIAIGFPYAKVGLKVDDNAKKVLHDMVAELGESVWREQPPEAEEQKPGRRRMWGIVGAEGNP